MRFSPEPEDADPARFEPVAAAFRNALIEAIYVGLRDAPLEDARREALTIAILLEICETLYCADPVEGRGGAVYPRVMLATSTEAREAIVAADAKPQFVENASFCEGARTDLLRAFIAIIDDRLNECEIWPPASIPIVSRIAEGVCAAIGGDTFMPTPLGDIAPLLGFAREPEAAEATIAGGASWTREDIASAVEAYFDL